MKTRILVVEDEFIVANDLRINLLKAGYDVCGIAASAEEAREIIETSKPVLVLLDIFLQNHSKGTDLANYLNERNIGFIYISANTDQKTLEAVKATNPYGFLVKPFRVQDLLIMLDIASEKHRLLQEQFAQRESTLKRELNLINTHHAEIPDKIFKVTEAIQSFIPFDHLQIRFLQKTGGITSQFHFVRTGYDEYQLLENEPGTNWNGRAGQLESGFHNQPAFQEWLEEAAHEKSFCLTHNLQAMLTDQISLDNREFMMLAFYSKKGDIYSDIHLRLLHSSGKLLAGMLAGLRYTQFRTEFSGAGKQTAKYPGKDRLPPAVKQHSHAIFSGIIGSSQPMLEVLDKIAIVAATATTVIITGESGTGKERVAKSIHQYSDRSHKPLVVVNCGALPAELIESELFGHERGAFTGAVDKRIGKFEKADGGTLFLDEIGELPLDAQVKLLRVLQEMEIERVGGTAPVKVDVRIIAATNRILEKEVAEGRFRLDLYYRLNVFPIALPPLRDHKEDIPLLAESFVEKFSQKMKRKIVSISEDAITSLLQYHWPGNVRELEHVIERTCLVSQSPVINAISLLNASDPTESTEDKPFHSQTAKTLNQMEADYIVHVLKSCHGRISGAGGAAEILGLPATTLHSKIKKLGIRKLFGTS